MSRRSGFLDYVEEQLRACPSQREMLEQVVEFSKDLPLFPEERKTPQNKVRGCLSLVYVDIRMDKQGKLTLNGYSDSFIISGFLAILKRAIDGLTRAEFEEEQEHLRAFLENTGMAMSQLQSRADTFGNIIQKIREQAGEEEKGDRRVHGNIRRHHIS
ncbi:MAG: SufE family protein [DPANN group archaeon]|nr:SufE family protein [DPANN group archaeon]